jgi:heme-degrading monooxygenase HmoA
MGQNQSVMVIFRSRLNPVSGAEYQRMAERMDTLARSMPAFTSFKTFAAPDGERVSIVEFESERAVSAWTNHREHLEAQRRGREAFYSEYRIQVPSPIRERTFKRPESQEPA